MSYLQIYKDFADLIQETYKPINNRINNKLVGGSLTNLMKNYSTPNISVYQNSNTIFVVVKGATFIEEQRAAIRNLSDTSLSTNVMINTFNQIKKIVSKLKGKEIIFVCHSLGCYNTTYSILKLGLRNKSFMFAPFIPKMNFITRAMSERNDIYVFVGEDDALANTILKFNKKHNVFRYKSSSKINNVKFRNLHSISYWLSYLPNNDLINKY